MSSPVRKNSSFPLVNHEQAPPSKQNSSPAVVQTKSPVITNFEVLTNLFFKACGDNYGNGEEGQPAIDATWNHLLEYVKKHPECNELLPRKPTNEKIPNEALAFIQYVRTGGWL